MTDKPKFMIHLQGSPYSNELYDEWGYCVYTLEEAIEAGLQQTRPDGIFEVYNGEESWSNHPPEPADAFLRPPRNFLDPSLPARQMLAELFELCYWDRMRARWTVSKFVDAEKIAQTVHDGFEKLASKGVNLPGDFDDMAV